MKAKEIIKSAEDSTIKYIFEKDGQILEFSYIDNGSGKNIICVPCQSMCNMSCTFCHLTDHIGKVPVNNLHRYDIIDAVCDIVEDLELTTDKPLLISYMGCGEPLRNIEAVIDSMLEFKQLFGDSVRFGLATMLPKNDWFQFMKLTKAVQDYDLPLKVHLSLHFTNNQTRGQWMPAALGIVPSLDLLNVYNSLTGQPIELHYTLMDGVNDSQSDFIILGNICQNMDVTIKLMRYSEKESLETKEAGERTIQTAIEILSQFCDKVEYYEPPGQDIGASCGQFLTNLKPETNEV